MHGKCMKCGVYGEVQRHHPLPQRWFSSSWTEPLCPKCHRWADNITLDIDADYGIVSEHHAKQIKDVFVNAFVVFMNMAT